MLALDCSGGLLAWSKFSNEQTVPFIFEDASYLLDPLFPFSLAPDFLVKVYTARFLGWAQLQGEGGSPVAGLELEQEVEKQGWG